MSFWNVKVPDLINSNEQCFCWLARTRKPSYDLRTPQTDSSLHTPARSPALIQGIPDRLTFTLWTQSWLLLSLGAARVFRTPQCRTGENDIRKLWHLNGVATSSPPSPLIFSFLIVFPPRHSWGQLCPGSLRSLGPVHGHTGTSTYSTLPQEAL